MAWYTWNFPLNHPKTSKKPWFFPGSKASTPGFCDLKHVVLYDSSVPRFMGLARRLGEVKFYDAFVDPESDWMIIVAWSSLGGKQNPAVAFSFF